jgi:hypothetical protein
MLTRSSWIALALWFVAFLLVAFLLPDDLVWKVVGFVAVALAGMITMRKLGLPRSEKDAA